MRTRFTVLLLIVGFAIALVMGYSNRGALAHGTTPAAPASPAAGNAPPPAAPATPAKPAPQAQPTTAIVADLKPIMKTEHLMEFFFEDTQKALSASMKAEPQNPRGWKDIRRRAEAFADLSNLVLLRTEYPDSAAWREKALAMRAAALDLATSTDAKNFGQSQEKYKTLINSCNSCHQKFEPTTATTINP